MSWERFGLSCHVLSGHNLLQSVHSAIGFLEVEGDVLPRHVMPNQIAAQLLFARRHHSPDDVVWWRSKKNAEAAAQTP